MKIEACEEVEMFEICRDLSYLGDFLLLTDETLGERTVSLLRNILKIENDRAMGNYFICIAKKTNKKYFTGYLNNHPDIWSLLLIFFTKLTLKHEEFLDQNIIALESAFVFENENVRYHALLALEDLCSLYVFLKLN